MDTKQKWIDSIRDANNSNCNGTETNYVCSLHFSDDAFESKNGKIQLVKGAIPTEFWVDILETFDEKSDCDDTKEIDTDLQTKYNELKQINLDSQNVFYVREASLLKKNHDLEQIVEWQTNEISTLKKSVIASQKLVEKLKMELVEAKAPTNINVGINHILEESLAFSQASRNFLVLELEIVISLLPYFDFNHFS